MSRIELRGLSKRYGHNLALSEVDLALEGQKIYGLLGRNGAGKTTLLNLLTAKTPPRWARLPSTVSLSGKMTRCSAGYST